MTEVPIPWCDLLPSSAQGPTEAIKCPGPEDARGNGGKASIHSTHFDRKSVNALTVGEPKQ